MKEITVAELKQKIQDGDNVYMIDVREPYEYEEQNNGAQLLPLEYFQRFELEQIKANKDDEIVCICKSGKRSMLATMILEQVGYTNVSNLRGGIMAWFA